MNLEAASLSRQGKKRDINQDALLEDVEHGIFAVADGMGGTDRGGLASQVAIECLTQAFVNHTEIIATEDVEQKLQLVLTAANRTILQMHSESGRTMGTTMTAAVVTADHCYVAHAGDSRAYLVNADGPKRLTEDETVVAEMVREGIISEDSARTHPRRNMLTGGLGLHERDKFQNYVFPWSKGDRLLLCTDGITGAISDKEVVEKLLSDTPLTTIVESLVDSAVAGGSLDDLTIIAIKNSC